MAPANDLAHRHGWRELLEDASKRRFDLVLVWRMDRAFRSVLDAATTLERPLYDLGDGRLRHSRSLSHLFGTHSVRYFAERGVPIKVVMHLAFQVAGLSSSLPQITTYR